LLNILWLENDAMKFKKVGDVLAGSFLQMLEPKHVDITKKAFEFLVEKLIFARMNNDTITSTIESILDRISEREIVGKFASFIPESASAMMDDIVYMLINANQKAVILEIIEKERSYENKKNIAASLVKTRDTEIIKKLFDKAGRQGFFKNRFLSDLVALCGTFKTAESLGHIKKILERRPFINTKAVRDIRVQAALSLGMIGTPEAMDAVRKFSDDTDNAVRAICRLILESNEAARKKGDPNG